jgi:hypothetical protein
MRVAREALAETVLLPRERTAVLIGMEPDAEVALAPRWRPAEADATPGCVAAQDAVIAAGSRRVSAACPISRPIA